MTIRSRDDGLRAVVPGFDSEWGSKLVLSPRASGPAGINVFHLVVQPAGGDPQSLRPPPGAYRQVVAATNLKQRTRTGRADHVRFRGDRPN